MGIKPLPARTIRDKRGTLMFPIETKGLIRAFRTGNPRTVHLATLEPGAVRGNHRHPHHIEYLVFLGGGGRIIFRQRDKIKSMKVRDGIVKIPANIPHAVSNEGRDILVVFCFYAGPENKRMNTIREEIA